MYNTKYQCRYNNDTIVLEYDGICEDDMRDILYKEDMLNIFNASSFEVFNDVIPELHKKLINHEKLKECMKMAAAKLLSEDTELGLCILYSFEYMSLTHECVSEYLDNGAINVENVDKLMNTVKT